LTAVGDASLPDLPVPQLRSQGAAADSNRCRINLRRFCLQLP
jgi:hypothetical protein